ncbi:MAG: N-acetylmuramoyl-L-alanine amidase [Candidatus Angelobacter sp.]
MRGALQMTAPAADPQVSPAPSQAAIDTARQEPYVLIDPSHGGDDKGVIFDNTLVEKDITLALARDLRKELQQRGIACRLLREADVNLTLQRRAEAANQPHVALYLAVHAGLGRGIQIYTPLPLSTPAEGPFVLWESAQARSLQHSRNIAKDVAKELNKQKLQSSTLDAPLRPLNNIDVPALALQVSADHNDVRLLKDARIQNAIASALADALVQTRAQWSAR